MKITKIRAGETIKVNKDWKTFEAEAIIEDIDNIEDISNQLKLWVKNKIRE